MVVYIEKKCSRCKHLKMMGSKASMCADCKKEYYSQNKHKNKEYAVKNRDKILLNHKRYYQENKNQFIQYRQENKEQIKNTMHNWRQANKQYINSYKKKYENDKWKNDPDFKLRKLVSNTIFGCLNSDGYNKNDSILNYLPYSILELKAHIESLFEPWMTWDNHGKYTRLTWIDNDQSTWTWNLDHIIPKSKLKYSSLEEDNFKKCWALDNLRPLSAKQNVIDNNRRD